MNLANDQAVLVTGAGGFIGKDLVSRLLKHGWRVRAMVRKNPPLAFPADDRLEVVYADMRDAPALVAAMKNIAVTVHLAAATSDEKESEEVNVGGAKRLVAACGAAGCKRLVNISTQSTKIPRKGTYARTKSEAENIFHDSGLEVTTLRPSLVYGGEKEGAFGTILGFVQRLPLVPVLGNGKWIFAPIYVGDVSQAVISCIERDSTIGKTYDLGGPDLITFDAFLDKICAQLGVRRYKLHIPFGVALWSARIIGKLLASPPITVSNVLGSNQNTDINIGPARRDFEFNPLDFDTGINRVLGKAPNAQVPGASARTMQPRATLEAELAAEGVVISRYLLGRKPPGELIDRYIAASRVLLREETIGPAEAELDFIRRHPIALPFIDAGTGLLRPQSIVRKKIILMTAILEATPTYADFFLSESEAIPRFLGGLAWQGLRSAVKITIGIPIFWLARRKS